MPNCIVWTLECDAAFIALKECLCSSPILQGPDFQSSVPAPTDASDREVGAVLSQLDDEGTKHPVVYYSYSRKLLPRKEKYATGEKECLAIKLAVHAFKVYLLGRHFTVQMSHRALEWLHRIKDSNAWLTTWSLAQQPFHSTVKLRTGKCNGNADALSHMCT